MLHKISGSRGRGLGMGFEVGGEGYRSRLIGVDGLFQRLGDLLKYFVRRTSSQSMDICVRTLMPSL